MTNSKEINNGLKKEITALYDIMKAEKLEELEIEDTDYHVHLKRKGKNSGKAAQAQTTVSMPVHEQPAPQAEPSLGETIKSPIMGVFYRAPSPTLPSFVKEGDTAAAGKTLCIVEAMKVMNEIKAEAGVKIVKILVENGNPVLAGQDLFVIEKA